jgi:hypothetical protein
VILALESTSENIAALTSAHTSILEKHVGIPQLKSEHASPDVDANSVRLVVSHVLLLDKRKEEPIVVRLPPVFKSDAIAREFAGSPLPNPDIIIQILRNHY